MSTGRQLVPTIAILALSTFGASAQNIAPAHSGTVHYFEGDVSVDGTKLVSQVARFTDLKDQSTLKTGQGRAEILLTPGVILRVAENSSIKMLDSRLISTRVEIVSGTAMLETDDSESSVKDPAVTIVYKDFQARPVRSGIFEISSESGNVRVFKGEAKVTNTAGTTVVVKDGNMVSLAPVMATAKFDAKVGDDLYLWARDRSGYLSAGNMASARALSASGYGNSAMGYANSIGVGGMGYGSGSVYAGWNPAMWSGFSGGWYYNSYLNMYSYLPFAGTVYSPFGYGMYNPVTIADVYSPTYYWSGAGGARTGTTTGLPLSSVTPGGSTARPALPRLGTTASTRPTLSAAAPGTQPGLSNNTGAVLAARNPGLVGSSSGSTAVSAPVAAPASSAAPMAAGVARVAAGRR